MALGRLSLPRRAPDAQALLAGGVLSLAIAYAVAILLRGADVAMVLPLVIAIVVVAIVVRPVVGVYAVFGAAILFEQFLIIGLDPITADTHFYQNLSAFTDIPLRLSPADLLMLLTLGAWYASVVRGRAPRPVLGPFGWAMAAYGAAFLVGTGIGVARGSWNADATLAEMRGPAQLCIAYLLATNLVRTRGVARVVVWELVLLVAVKAVQGILNAEQASSLPVDLEAVTGHEDVVFFDVVLALAFAAFALRARSKLALVFMLVTPLIIVAELLTERRVGFIALGVGLVIVLVVTARRAPRRALILTTCGALAATVYVAAFWDAQGAIAEPIRAVRAVVDPGYLSVRDEMSDDWRVIEDRNIAYTIQQLPLTGVGLGQEYLVSVKPPPLPPTFTYWRYITHNALLWLWLMAGPLGAFGLWFLAARVVLFGSAVATRAASVEVRWLALLPLGLLASQVVFSAVELGLTYSRTMIVLGTVLGIAMSLARPEDEAPAR